MAAPRSLSPCRPAGLRINWMCHCICHLFLSASFLKVKGRLSCLTQLFGWSRWIWMCVETRVPSPRSELCSSLKRHASFVFLHGAWWDEAGGGRSLYSGEEMWHNKHKQRLASWHEANDAFTHTRKGKRGGRTCFFGKCKFEDHVRLRWPRFRLLWSRLKEWQHESLPRLAPKTGAFFCCCCQRSKSGH